MEELQKEGGCGMNLLAFLIAFGALAAIVLLGGGNSPDQVIASGMNQSQGIPPVAIVIFGVLGAVVLFRMIEGKL